jgi:hypothetical protein
MFLGAVISAALVCARLDIVILFPGISLICAGAFSAVCCWKGEPARWPWRWEDETGSAQDLRDEN